jgi:hypothetical protein
MSDTPGRPSASEQRELDQYQAIIDLDQSIADREQSRADHQQSDLDLLQRDLDTELAGTDHDQFEDRVRVAQRQTELHRSEAVAQMGSVCGV